MITYFNFMKLVDKCHLLVTEFKNSVTKEKLSTKSHSKKFLGCQWHRRCRYWDMPIEDNC